MTKLRRGRSPQSQRDQALLDEQQQSGLTIAAFAREQGIPAWRLYHARQARDARRSRSLDLVEVGVDPVHVPPTASDLEMVLPNGLRIAVPTTFDESTLRRLLSVLASC